QGQQQAKRLFTPQIKRFLKGWLVRRRNNPYPNRTEKKELAFKTGLTYIQICNWFANWRRKLKNSSRNTEESWGHLIKDYNNKAKGNVEQFSISSDDSIWDETAFNIGRHTTLSYTLAAIGSPITTYPSYWPMTCTTGSDIPTPDSATGRQCSARRNNVGTQEEPNNYYPLLPDSSQTIYKLTTAGHINPITSRNL
ncbi:hypothetical protein AAG570_002053, partial [Ranatra chinensis]